MGHLTAPPRPLTLIAQGPTNTEIAAHPHPGPQTIKTHVSNTLTELGVRDRTQAVIAAHHSGLIQPARPT